MTIFLWGNEEVYNSKDIIKENKEVLATYNLVTKETQGC